MLGLALACLVGRLAWLPVLTLVRVLVLFLGQWQTRLSLALTNCLARTTRYQMRLFSTTSLRLAFRSQAPQQNESQRLLPVEQSVGLGSMRSQEKSPKEQRQVA